MLLVLSLFPRSPLATPAARWPLYRRCAVLLLLLIQFRSIRCATRSPKSWRQICRRTERWLRNLPTDTESAQNPSNLATQADLVDFVHMVDGPQALDYNLVIGRGTFGRPYAFITYAEEDECVWARQYFNYECVFYEGTKKHNTNAVFVDFLPYQ